MHKQRLLDGKRRNNDNATFAKQHGQRACIGSSLSARSITALSYRLNMRLMTTSRMFPAEPCQEMAWRRCFIHKNGFKWTTRLIVSSCSWIFEIYGLPLYFRRRTFRHVRQPHSLYSELVQYCMEMFSIYMRIPVHLMLSANFNVTGHFENLW